MVLRQLRMPVSNARLSLGRISYCCWIKIASHQNPWFAICCTASKPKLGADGALSVGAVGPAIVNGRNGETYHLLIDCGGVPEKKSLPVDSATTPALVEVAVMAASGMLIAVKAIARVAACDRNISLIMLIRNGVSEPDNWVSVFFACLLRRWSTSSEML